MSLSKVNLLTNSVLRGWGTASTRNGGAILNELSNLTITDTILTDNLAINGPAVAIIGTVDHPSVSSISGCTFENNIAGVKGGAIYYSLQRPELSNNTYTNNTAQYGQNIASYATKIILTRSQASSLTISNVGSGLTYPRDLILSLIDYDNQTMVLDNESTLKLSAIDPNASVSGTDYAKVNQGVSTFSNIIPISKAGSKNILFKVASDSVDFDFIINATFRYWMPGEYETTDGQWVECSYGTYTLDWNLTQWISCIDDATWLGGKQISLDDGYWRENANSTTAIEWPRKDSWKGGYQEEYDAPTNCANGYAGILCTDCLITDDVKYQPLSNFQCGKCPNSTLNFIRVVGFSIIALLFIACIMVVNIRKKKENEFSILLRIFTNYIQLTTAAMTFNIDLPSSFTDSYSMSDRVSSPNESFFSFDCFIKDYELKWFAPNNNLFKLFLLFLLPFILMAFFSVVFILYKLILKIIRPHSDVDLKRYFIVSLVCVIFIFHPRMSYESLTVLQWIKINDNEFRMRNNLEYDWYSSDHILWILIVALPMMLIWVIGTPLLALSILIHQRNNLDSWEVKKYLLVIYQGLKPKAFYWEFVNTLRKLVILGINALLFSFEAEYRILFGMCK